VPQIGYLQVLFIVIINNIYFFICCRAATQRGSWPPHSWCF